MAAAHPDKDVGHEGAGGRARIVEHQAHLSSSLPDDRPRSRGRRGPITLEQEPFALLARAAGNPGVGTEYVLATIRGPLCRRALMDALGGLYEACDAWRLGLEWRSGGPTSWVREPHELRDLLPRALRYVDLGPVPAAERDARLEEQLQAQLSSPFRLDRDLLIRATLFRLEDDRHALLVGGHHIALDGYSLFTLLPRLLAARYRDARRSALESSPDLPRYRDFVGWSRHDLDSSRAANEAYWSEALRDAPPALDLPLDRPRRPHRSFVGHRVSALVDSEACRMVEARAGRIGVRASDLWLGALGLLLGRYCAQDDLLIELPYANRRTAEIEDLFGCVMRSVPVRCRPDLRSTVQDYLQKVRAAKIEAREHLDPRVSEFVAGSTTNASFASPQVVFNFQPAVMAFELEGLEVSAERMDSGWTARDASFHVAAEPGGYSCTLEYDRDLFDAESAARMLGHYVHVVSQLGADPSTELADVRISPPLEASALERGLDGGPLAASADASVLDRIERFVATQPDATALVCGAESLTYRELWSRALGVAQRLTAACVGPGAFVALVLDDPPSMVAAMLGVLQSGAAYVPLTSETSLAHIQRALDDCRPAAIVTDARAWVDLADQDWASTHVLFVDDAAGPPIAHLAGDRRTDGPAYLLYTSGSTGTPKGVVVDHANLLAQLESRCQIYGEQRPKCLSLHCLSFDSVVAFQYWALGTGGALHLPTSEARRDPQALLQTIREHGLTHLDAIPSMYRELCAGDRDGALTGLTDVVLGGEALSLGVLRAHMRAAPQATVHNEYGPSETTVFSTVAHYEGAVPERVTIGRPIPGTWCFVVDDRGRPAPIGVPGELQIGGAGVARGYHRREALTRERFIANPFPVGGPRLYRTGDRVRRLANGELEFLDRLDRQVKIRGYRVELGQVESALTGLSAVEQAAALAVTRGSPDPWLVAFVVLTQPTAVGELRRALAETLPSYMLPRQIRVVDRMPKISAGKVDHRALEATLDEPSRADEAAVYPEFFPRTQTEDRIATLWADLLHYPGIGRDQDFFAVGGDSVLAIRMLGELGRHFGTHLPLSTFVHARTVEQLAARLHADGYVAEESLLVEYRRGSRLPFWMFPPVDGHIVFAQRLLRYLPPEQTLYGLQARGLDGRRSPLSSMHEMTQTYVDILNERQPEGPVRLGGPSHGGLIAWEVARRLQARGREVALVALFDTWAPSYPVKLSPARRLWARVNEGRFGLREVVSRGLEKLQGQASDGYRHFDPMDRLGEAVADERVQALMAGTAQVFDVNQKFMDAYQPRRSSFPVHLFRANPPEGWPGVSFADGTNGWAALCESAVAVTQFDCEHNALLEEPMVQDVARCLVELLGGADD